MQFWAVRFNPIHNGHLHLIKRFSEKNWFDRVILIPQSSYPRGRTFERMQYASCPYRRRLAAKEFGYEVSDMEVQESN
ncbi:MAG: hypothetical protein ACLTE2_05880 [Eubacteriales bacterium]